MSEQLPVITQLEGRGQAVSKHHHIRPHQQRKTNRAASDEVASQQWRVNKAGGGLDQQRR